MLDGDDRGPTYASYWDHIEEVPCQEGFRFFFNKCVQIGIGIVHVALFDVPSVLGGCDIQKEHDVPERFSDNKYATKCEFVRTHRAVAGITLRSRAPVMGAWLKALERRSSVSLDICNQQSYGSPTIWWRLQNS